MFPIAALMATLFSGAYRSASRECEPPDSSRAISAVRVLNRAYIDAARGNDVTWFRRHLAENVAWCWAAGADS